MRFTSQYLAILMAIIAIFLTVGCSGGGGQDMRLVSAAQNVTVSPVAPNGWGIYDDVAETFSALTAGDYILGPATPPLGEDSIQISVTGNQRLNLATYQFASTKLATITDLKFSTYNGSAGNNSGPNASGYLQFNVSFNGLDTWQRRLLCLPKDNGTIAADTWQSWDCINGGAALWRWSGGSTWPDGYVGATRTWSSILAAFPNAQIRDTDSFFGIRVGEPYPNGYTENLDAVVFGAGGNTVTFNFELTNKDDCKNGGWQALGFKNQGECIAAHNKAD